MRELNTSEKFGDGGGRESMDMKEGICACVCLNSVWPVIEVI